MSNRKYLCMGCDSAMVFDPRYLCDPCHEKKWDVINAAMREHEASLKPEYR